MGSGFEASLFFQMFRPCRTFAMLLSSTIRRFVFSGNFSFARASANCVCIVLMNLFFVSDMRAALPASCRFSAFVLSCGTNMRSTCL